MMPPSEPFGARPRRLRQSPAPKTPEPTSEGQAQQPPSPPRLRFRLRRRTASQLNAPTSHFLASVAAADVPVPSIEEPQIYDDQDMLSIAYPALPRLDPFDDILLTEESSRDRTFSPPKTPGPGLAPSLSPKQFPDWSIDGTLSSLESSPEYESSRPSTARSTQTSSSLFSRYSMASDDLSQCASPESEQRNERLGRFLAPGDADYKTNKPPTRPARCAQSRRAPWTKPMSQHLWSTYMTYLQDPKVTPFRVGKSGIPPSGVCMRVAREAKRSWKGSRPQAKPAGNKSGSSTPTPTPTPTPESAGPYIEWPHTCAATRGHLRELCKAHSASTARHIQYLSRSPTPFGKTAHRFWTRRSVPARSPSVFSASDMALSLTVSTADSMQIQGPLAQLTSSQLEPAAAGPSPPLPLPSPLPSPAEPPAFTFGGDLLLLQQSRPPRLGSPFMARSYGPSSSGWVGGGGLGESSEVQRQSRTVGTRRGLGSPVRLDQSRSSTQKRRSRQSSVLEPRRTKRPSLGSDFWIDPSVNEEAEAEAECASPPPLAEFSSTDSSLRDNLFVPRTNLQELFESSNPTPGPTGPARRFPPTTTTALASSQTVPARLGSPFAAGTTSHSFPNRRHSRVSSLDIGAIFRPFATVHQPGGGRPNNHVGTAPTSSSASTKTPLVNRLAYIDERLKDFRRRGKNSRRSKSPF